MKAAIVVPSIRPESLKRFLNVWGMEFLKKEITMVIVEDGKQPKANDLGIKEIMGKDADLIYNFNDGVRNLGFAYIAKHLPEVEVIFTFDDDVLPYGETLETHFKVLEQRVPISWISTAQRYTRGFPYGIRQEAEVVLSHGVWEGIKDYDAPTNLVLGNPDTEFYQGVIPKGVYFPMCGMNLAFKRKLLPYLYWAPMGEKVGLDRFADIWAGICAKRVIDEKGWAVMTGYAKVRHEKASNVLVNLQKEAKGIVFNEGFWQGVAEGDYFKLYEEKRKRWEAFINENQRRNS